MILLRKNKQTKTPKPRKKPIPKAKEKNTISDIVK